VSDCNDLQEQEGVVQWLTLKLSRIGARSWQHGKLYLSC
jgi:hypothetical protein